MVAYPVKITLLVSCPKYWRVATPLPSATTRTAAYMSAQGVPTSCFLSAEKLNETRLSHVEIMCISCWFLATGDSYTTITHSLGTVIGWFMNMYDASSRRRVVNRDMFDLRRVLTRLGRKLTLKTMCLI